jgi:AraC-like DNA-binding protein
LNSKKFERLCEDKIQKTFDMPIYMDRHDVSEATAEHVAQLHQQDLKIQHQFGCRGLTYWFDDKRKTAFCLIEAPDMKAIQDMHNHAHGEIPNHIIEVEAGIVESFLGRIEDPPKTRNTELNVIDDPAFRTIMVIALKKLKPLQTDPLKFKSLSGEFNGEVINILNIRKGNIVRQTAYQYLVSFKSVSNAVHAAFDIQSFFTKINNDKLNGEIILKIGLNAGVPVTKKQLLFEDTIKLAERVCEIVKGGIIVSTEVTYLYNNENANPLDENKNIISLTRADEQFITLLMDYMDSVWSDTNLKVDDFSKPLACSKSQLYRKMISLTGKSPNTFIKEYRLNEALKLLNKNAGNISEIAFETGFSSPSYFSKCFQQQFGHFPSEYLPAHAN